MPSADFPVSPTPTPSSIFLCDYSDWSSTSSIIPSIYLLAFLVGCLGNGLVLWAYWHQADGRRMLFGDERLCGDTCCSSPTGLQRAKTATRDSSGHGSARRPSRTLTESLIASLASADLCFLLTLPLWAAYTAMGYHWPFGRPLCQISSFLTALNMYASVFSLSALGVERYCVLTGRRRPPRSCPNRTLWILGGIWAVAGILAFPGLLLRSVREVELEPAVLSCQMDYSLLIGAELDEDEAERAEVWWAAVMSVKSTLIGFLLPLAVLLVCYCSLARLLSRHFRQGPRPDRRRQRRLLRVIVSLLMAFFLCWLPLHVNKSVSLLLEFGVVPHSCSLDRALLAAHPYVTCLAYLNSCLNPLLYAACDPSFRRTCRWALLLCCRMRQGGSHRPERNETEEEEKHRSCSAVPIETHEDTADRTEEEEDRL